MFYFWREIRRNISMKQRKRIFCAMLSVLMLFSGCGRRQASGGEAAVKKEGSTAVVRAASNLELRQDPVIQSHIENNRTLDISHKESLAENFHFYIENTQTMEGFVTPTVTTNFQESVQSLLDVALNSFPNLDAHMLGYSDDSRELEWEETALDKKFIRKIQTRSFYTGNQLDEISPLEAIAWEEDCAMEANGVTVIASNFVEPGNDLTAISVTIESYFDEFENSAACIMGMTSQFEGDLHIPYDGSRGVNYRVTGFAGEVPFYLVMFGPETAVRTLVKNLEEHLYVKGIAPTYDIYTNNANAQILANPLNFDVIGDLKRKKAPADLIRSYNTGELYEDDAGNVYYAASSGRVETLDAEANGGISSSTQISIMSKDYDGSSQYNWDYKLYSYDGAEKKWVEEGKNALSKTTVVVQHENGLLVDEQADEPILAAGRKEMRISTKLDFSNTSPLIREQIYRVEVKLYLNRAGTNSNGAMGSSLDGYSVTRAEYDAAIDRLPDGWGSTKIWTAAPALHKRLIPILARTPNLSDLLTSLERLETKYQDDRELIEYVDFVFNVPSEEQGE